MRTRIFLKLIFNKLKPSPAAFHWIFCLILETGDQLHYKNDIDLIGWKEVGRQNGKPMHTSESVWIMEVENFIFESEGKNHFGSGNIQE